MAETIERLIHIEGKVDRIEEKLNEESNKSGLYLKSYSQNGEDVLIYHFFNKRKITPFYIDIGAHGYVRGRTDSQGTNSENIHNRQNSVIAL